MNKFLEMSTFVAVVDAGGISETANRLGTTKSVVSQRIKQLENRLGISLFDRGYRLYATEVGRDFYVQCVRILADLATVEESMLSEKSTLKGGLRLAAPMAFSTPYLTDILPAFAIQYPNLQLDIESSDRKVNLQDENYDVAIRMGQLTDSSLIAKPITFNRHLICAHPSYLKRYGTPHHPAELINHEGLLYIHREPHGMWQLPVEGKIQSFRIRSRMRTDNAHMLMEAARTGLGLAILPTFIAAEYIASGELQVVLPQYSPSGGDISVVYRQSKRASLRIQAFVKFLTDHIGCPPPWEMLIAAKLLEIECKHNMKFNK
ncbi:LysR family transcriptional regulator [Pseudoalteromonas arctica]|uniref:LysR family transcriptional regulator n=1 Tax=Pseudoalteromonas arctica TaxID=394751 RepID=A0A7Y0DQV6_9GAMM|nr:LysR family transcriptional regulator [Pseudoalteromonas arctica]NMM39944.1 LysR family transcriptional regulator [Pseudoalteromonas arctica]